MHCTPEQRRLIKALFGGPSRLLLAAWILERQGEAFYLGEAQDVLRLVGVAGSAVQGDLKRFVTHGMLLETGVAHRNYYLQTASPLWPAYQALADALGLVDTQGVPLQVSEPANGHGPDSV